MISNTDRNTWMKRWPAVSGSAAEDVARRNPPASSRSLETVLSIPTAVRLGGGSVAERWGVYIIMTMRASTDPKTIGIWARLIGVSRSSLCECCRLIHVSPHDARDFGRLMRVIHCSGSKWEPEAFLDLADARTLNKLLLRAGLKTGVIEKPTIFEFLDRQQWIPRTNPGLVRLRERLLENAPYVSRIAAACSR